MRLRFFTLATISLALASTAAQAAHTKPRLILAADTARAGEELMAGIELQMDAKWHTYWKNAGDSGLATTVEWELPQGIEAGEIQWPLPEKLTEEGLTTYIYQRAVVLLVPLKLAPNLPAGPLTLKAKVSWLECEVRCVPGEGEVEAKLVIGSQNRASPDAKVIAAWQKKLPKDGATLAARARWEKEPAGDTRALLIEWAIAESSRRADFFPYASEQFEVLGDTEILPGKSSEMRLRKQVRKLSGDWPAELAGVLVQFDGAQGQTGFEIKLSLGQKQADAAAKAQRSGLRKLIKHAFLNTNRTKGKENAL